MEQNSFKRHIRRKRLIIFDADGTLRRCTVEGQPCPNKENQSELLPGVKDFFRHLSDWNRSAGSIDFEKKIHVGVASNQGGVQFGYLSEATARGLIYRDLKEAMGNNMHNTDICIEVCPSNEDSDPMRKPNPGMLIKLMKHFRVKREEVLFVGDRQVDEEAAQNASVDFMYANTFFPCQKQDE